MRYLILSMCTVLLACVCIACAYNEVDPQAYNEVDPQAASTTSIPEFVQVADRDGYRIVYDANTKVMYAVSDGGYNNGNFSVLYDADGTPLLYSEIDNSNVQ